MVRAALCRETRLVNTLKLCLTMLQHCMRNGKAMTCRDGGELDIRLLSKVRDILYFTVNYAAARMAVSFRYVRYRQRKSSE